MCILTAWLKTSHPKCLCSAHSFHLHAIHDVCVIVCWLRPRSVFLLFLSVVCLFSSTLYLHSDQHFLSNANSVEGTNHCAFAQLGVLPCGDIPSSHKKKHHERRQTTTERSEQEDQKVHQRQKKNKKTRNNTADSRRIQRDQEHIMPCLR